MLPVHISRSNIGEEVLLEPTKNLVKKGLVSARFAITATKGKSVIRILNPRDKTVYLPKRFVLANVGEMDPKCQKMGNKLR